MSDPIEHTAKFRIPASFIVDWARLTPRELHYGYTNQWISSADVVELALGSIVPSGSKMGIVEEISLLLSDELDRIPELMDQLIDRDDRVWTYLALAWVHENQEEFDDPFKTVDLIFADFGYPQDVGEFVTFMPPPPGGVPRYPGLRQRWKGYLEQNRSEFFLSRTPGARNDPREDT
ncbi:DUF2247 family protein [Nocardia farcinica]|uniref:DUF2247 family protein n=1 Tax=Nocardia farcinica TaxID=37329 RepID=UPI002456194E|nr:DUF2247 family protein [Nocardia farcinica]